MTIVSEIAVFRTASGELLFNAPATAKPVDAALGWVDLPSGYDDALFRWDAEARIMAPDLTAIRAARWTLVKAGRDRAEWWGCSTMLGRVDTDPESQRKTSGAVQLAMIAQAAGVPFAIDWTMQDNSVAAHDAAAMIAMGVAVGQHVAACHAAALIKRQALADAADVAAIEVVDVDTGWPDAPAG